MAGWVKCEGAAGGPVFVNLDNVAFVTPVHGGSEISFVAGEDSLLVASTAEHILSSQEISGD